MILKRLPLGMLMTNCYIFGDSETNEIVIIDPADEAEKIINEIDGSKYDVKYIAFTHAHFDHITALDQVKNRYNAPIANDKTEFFVGRYKIEVIKTPGHSIDGLCFKTDNILFSGDTLFNMSVGRCDLEGGSLAELENSVKMLYTLPDETIVYPGHGISTTIGKEKRSNPYIRG